MCWKSKPSLLVHPSIPNLYLHPHPCKTTYSFGAAGDGQQDDTSALVQAINTLTVGVIYLPAGVYKISQVITIRKPIVLRGDGPRQTILHLPRSLTDILGNAWKGGRSDHTHGGRRLRHAGKLAEISDSNSEGGRPVCVEHVVAVGFHNSQASIRLRAGAEAQGMQLSLDIA
jgi:hypothetical protein